jgi:outer membrane protein assembly factor BamA
MKICDRCGIDKKATLCLMVVVIFATLDPAVTAQETAQSGLPPGWITPITPGIVQEPTLLRKLAGASDNNVGGEPKDGLYAEFGNMITGEGWISAGPGYRRQILNGAARIDVSAALSWNLYKTVQGSFELPHVAHDRLSIGAQTMYQDVLQVEYFGLGNDSRKSDQSAYRFTNLDVVGFASLRATTWLSVNGRFGWIPRPDLSTATGPRVNFPNTLDRFTDASAPGIRTQPSFIHSDLSIVADSRDHAGHPTNGGLYRVGAAIYSDRDAGTYSFRRYDIEGSQFVPLFTKKWILALHGWEVFSDTSSDDVVPFYLMPSLGGKNTLRGYFDYRFHDNDMESFNAESRWALFTHVDAVVFADAGKVAPRVRDLDLRHVRTSYGVGLRVHNATSTLLRLDVGHSGEGWHVFLKVSDPFKRSTPASGRQAVVPFVP